jgi:phage gp36-like protein
MAYSTENDLLTMIPVKELAELTTDSGDTPDSQVVAEAINRADAEIDAYVGVRYATPAYGRCRIRSRGCPSIWPSTTSIPGAAWPPRCGGRNMRRL